MWEMLDPDIECGTECGGPGPPPEFLIPPPPRPPFLLQEITKCSEDPLPDIEMCEAIPILDTSYHSSPSLQTSAMIIVCSVLLVLVVMISSLLVWKHKRKVQNFLPCKTPTRGGHLDTNGVSGGHSVTYEDPDAHLGRRPLVMRHHHNMEMLHSKSIHFPSGYPMTRSPPLFVCSSPGPDPYRSHDNVYEELGPPRDSDADSEPPIHSDDDFAEDELSLPGERSFHKNSPDAATVATIYHERVTEGNGTSNGGRGTLLERAMNERNSLLSSSSSNDRGGSNRISSPSSLFRGRKVYNSARNGKLPNYSADELNTSSEHNNSDVVPTIYDERNMMTLPYSHSNNINNNCSSNNNNHNNNNNINNNNNNNNRNNTINSFSMSTTTTTGGDNDIERRNQINSQLSNNPVATIFRERGNFNTNNRSYGPHHQQQHQQHHHHHLTPTQQQHLYNNRSRTNPRSLDRRRIIGTNPHISGSITTDPNYGYTEPVFHEAILYDACLAHSINDRNHAYPYILPEFTTFRNASSNAATSATGIVGQQLLTTPAIVSTATTPTGTSVTTQPFARDSSFGSDSGYSQHTHTSNRSIGWGIPGRRIKDNSMKNNTYNGS